VLPAIIQQEKNKSLSHIFRNKKINIFIDFLGLKKLFLILAAKFPFLNCYDSFHMNNWVSCRRPVEPQPGAGRIRGVADAGRARASGGRLKAPLPDPGHGRPLERDDAAAGGADCAADRALQRILLRGGTNLRVTNSFRRLKLVQAQDTWINPAHCLVEKALQQWANLKLRADNTSAVTLMLDPPGPPRFQVNTNTHLHYFFFLAFYFDANIIQSIILVVVAIFTAWLIVSVKMVILEDDHVERSVISQHKRWRPH
jgi:hypothetical protein